MCTAKPSFLNAHLSTLPVYPVSDKFAIFVVKNFHKWMFNNKAPKIKCRVKGKRLETSSYKVKWSMMWPLLDCKSSFLPVEIYLTCSPGSVCRPWELAGQFSWRNSALSSAFTTFFFSFFFLPSLLFSCLIYSQNFVGSSNPCVLQYTVCSLKSRSLMW